jgi:hypothetical protein
MARPDIGFTVEHDGRRTLKVQANEDRPSRVAALTDRELAANSLAIDYERGSAHLGGVAGLPTFNRGVADHQYLFVNGRPVKDRLLIGAVRAAYQDLLARDRHPVIALFIDLPGDEVDVNVHPAKTEVRFRDPAGIRPLVLGRLEDDHVLASETSALDLLGADFVREIDPGELVVVDEQGMRAIKATEEESAGALCIFEFIYFARPDSTMRGVELHGARIRMGERLAAEAPADADLVMGIPDSGTPAAIGFARASGIPFYEGLIKNRYVGRTCIQPDQALRGLSIRAYQRSGGAPGRQPCAPQCLAHINIAQAGDDALIREDRLERRGALRKARRERLR